MWYLQKIEKFYDITCDKKKQNQPWFDYECKKARDNYHRVRNKMKFFNSNEWEEKLKKSIKMFEDNHIEEKVTILWYCS